MRYALGVVMAALALMWCGAVAADPMTAEEAAARVVPPYSLGDVVNEKGVWQVLNSGGAPAGYAFETGQLAPLPGFSGQPIQLFVLMDLEGRFIDVQLVDHNEPIFVSGLGQAPFHAFFEQYPGLSISQPMVVGSPYGSEAAGAGPVYLDGVTKATASVRIAHESLLAASLAVAREKMQGLSLEPPARPDPAHDEALDWAAMLADGIVGHLRVSNAEINAEFEGTIWAEDDPEAAADPEGVYLDLYVADIGPNSVARALLSAESLAELGRFMEISPDDEPMLVIEAGRHGLVTEAFVRNTTPRLVSVVQGGLPVAIRDADIFTELGEGVPEALRDGVAMILRTDRRLGFDPAAPWEITVQAERAHGSFQPQIGDVALALEQETPERFFMRPEVVKPAPPWLEALRGRALDVGLLAGLLVGLMLALGPGQHWLAGHRYYRAIRFGYLAVMTGFVGWWGQGQLSIVTPLAALRAGLDGGSFAFLLYDPFSLLIWGAVILSFVLWGRGLFCGWLCPFGALQEFADKLGRLLRLPQVEPTAAWDRRLKWLKYLVLAGLVGVIVLRPGAVDKAAEVEPFKTAITTFFMREWYYVAYAVGWLLAGMVLFKGFCRYVCPLGALMAIGGMLRGRDWIERRAECGSPCQLCRVKCPYGAIEKSGKISYDECFACLDCVTIHDDPAQCVPLVLAEKRRRAA